MTMPTDIGVIDLMLDFPSPDQHDWYEFLKPQLREEFINKLYGIWYNSDSGTVLSVSQTTYREYIPTPLSVASGDYLVVSTTENGGTIKVLDFTYDGYNAGDTLVEFDFGTIGDNQIQRRYAGKSWLNYIAAEYLGGGQYRIPFLFAGQDIFSFD